MDRGEANLKSIAEKLDEDLSYTFNENGTLRHGDFYNRLFKQFANESGYYGWSGLRYFLYEYELSLLSKSRHKKVDWSDLLKSEKDKISIEHIYPQTETREWARCFKGIDEGNRHYYNATLGNLLLLSMSINSSLQNDSFADKKNVKLDETGRKIRNGYADGSHSEIEVSKSDLWGPEQIHDRGLKLLKFMEKRWEFKFENNEARETLLFLNVSEETK